MVKFFKNINLFYRNDPNYVPQLIGERLALVNKKKNPFYEHGDIAHFVAYKNGGVAGMISGITNENHNKQYNDNLGFFGFFECEDDQDVANALVQRALEWNIERGKSGMRGPFHPSINDETGILIEGFDEPPVILTRYNCKYYDKLLLNTGLKKAKDLNSYDLRMETFVSPKMKRLEKTIASRYNITHKSLDFKNKDIFASQMAEVKKIYDKAWEPNWGMVKLTDKEFDHIVADLRRTVDRRLPFLTYVDDKLAGMAIVLQDLNQIMIYNKKQTLAGMIWKMLTKKKEVNRVRIFLLGLLPEFQRTGIDTMIYQEVGRRVKEAGYNRGEASWVAEDNYMMNRAATITMKGTLYKKHRVYEISAEDMLINENETNE